MIKIGILGSGRGSNAEAILKAECKGELGNTHVAGIISDVEDSGILSHGSNYNKPSLFISPGPYKTRLSHEQEALYVQQLKDWDCDLVVLAGFMRIVKDRLLEAFSERIINLHPSLLPKYPGLSSIKRAYEAQDSITGCTVHWVDSGIDTGHIIAQKEVSIYPNENLCDLEKRVHAAEHELLPAVIRELSQKLQTT